VSAYTVYVTPPALREIKALPGHVRQRVRRAVDGFADDPRPSGSKKLDLPEPDCDVWRLRLDKWRIVYAISEADKAVGVFAVRTRPPYDYGDLEKLLSEL
jgi:mRNA interferase RelE/StbE